MDANANEARALPVLSATSGQNDPDYSADRTPLVPCLWLFLVDETSADPAVTEQVQSNQEADLKQDDDDATSPLQPRTERPTSWSVAVTSPGAANASAGTSSGSSGVTGGGATAPAAALPGATTGLVTPDYDFAFRMECSRSCAPTC